MGSLPRAILFDLDETILSFGRRSLLLQEVAEDFRAELAPLSPADVAGAIEASMVRFWADPVRHKAWRFQLAEARRIIVDEGFQTLPRPAGRPWAADLVQRFADRFHAHREAQIRFFPGACETLDTLKQRGVRLALVTNGAAGPQRAKIEQFDLAPRFDHVQIEGEHGFGKPEARAYLHAMDALGVAARETWMVGDNLEWEVAAPQRLGIYAIWHDHLGEGLPAGGAITPDRIITALPQLLD